MANVKPLGRRAPVDWAHYDKYPLRAADIEAITTPTPVIIGINWYDVMDDPRDDKGRYYFPGRTPVGHWWVGRDPKKLGSVRGGHCVCLKPRGVRDHFWNFYDQGSEGACVGFGASRAMSLENDRRYFARWLWDRCKEIDPWDDTNPGDNEGTDVNSALKILRNSGHVRWKDEYAPFNDDYRDRLALAPSLNEGISSYRWIKSMDDMLTVLGYQGLDYCDILNSWGKDYPHLVRIPVDTLERLWYEDGEFGVITDR